MKLSIKEAVNKIFCLCYMLVVTVGLGLWDDVDPLARVE